MKTKKMMALAGLLVASHLCLAACQSQTNHQPNHPKTKQSSKKTATKKTKMAKKARDPKKAHKGVGCRFPNR
ncbi:hypothetical protein ScOT1_10170 [Streptococcus canis]|nr:hypothetical protein ScOT1_10170 [Streptococcus canis]